MAIKIVSKPEEHRTPEAGAATPTPRKRGPKRGSKRRPHKPGFERLRALGEERLAAIDQMLMKGYACMRVASIIQEEWGESKDIQLLTLTRQVQRYKDTELQPTLAVFSKDVLEPDHQKVIIAAQAERLDVLKELEELAVAQKGRVSKMLIKETGMPMLISSVSSEMRLYMNMLTELANTQMETGHLRRVSRKMDLSASLVQTDGATYVAASAQVQDEVAIATAAAMKELQGLGLFDIDDAEDAVYAQ